MLNLAVRKLTNDWTFYGSVGALPLHALRTAASTNTKHFDPLYTPRLELAGHRRLFTAVNR